MEILDLGHVLKALETEKNSIKSFVALIRTLMVVRAEGVAITKDQAQYVTGLIKRWSEDYYRDFGIMATAAYLNSLNSIQRS